MSRDTKILDKGNLISQLNKIYELRSLLEKTNDFQEEVDIINQLSLKIKQLKTMVSDALDDDSVEDTDFKLKELQNDLRKAAEEYDSSCRKMQGIIEEQNKCIDNDNGLLNDDEIHNIRLKYLEKKLKENRKSVLIKNRIEQIRKKLEDLDISDTMDKKKALVHDNKMHLDNIEFLYFLDTEFIKRGLPSLYIASISDFERIKNSVLKRPEKIVNSSIEKLYIPGDAPKDMMVKYEHSDIEEEKSFQELASEVSSIMKKLQFIDTNNKNEYKASNIHVSEAFKNELIGNKYDYDIVCSVPYVTFVDNDILFQISSDLIRTNEMKNYATRIKDSIEEKLSKEEINLLLDWYQKLKLKIGDCPMIHNDIFKDISNK